MNYVSFSKHNHAVDGGSVHHNLFAIDSDAQARVTAHAAAYELADYIGGQVSFIGHSQNGKLWVVFQDGSSYGTFYISNECESPEKTIHDPTFEEMQNIVGIL